MNTTTQQEGMQLFVRIISDEEAKNRYYPAECPHCGWVGSSAKLKGGGQIADTGDYDDVYCPVCGSIDTEDAENEQTIIDYIRRLEKATAMVKKLSDEVKGYDCSKYIYSHLEVENKKLHDLVRRSWPHIQAMQEDNIHDPGVGLHRDEELQKLFLELKEIFGG